MSDLPRGLCLPLQCPNYDQIISFNIQHFVSRRNCLLYSVPEFLHVAFIIVTYITYKMQVELSTLLDAVQETETKMVEMSALNHLMSTHVLRQAQQIEYLYDQVRIAPTFSLCI